MLFVLRLGIRNLARNRRRALIAGCAIGLGLAALIFCDAFILGMQDNLIGAATDSFLGHGQIHAAGYREMPVVESTVNDLPELRRRLAADPEVKAFAERILSFAMIASPANVAAVQLVGIDPEAEAKLSQFDEALAEGSFLEGDRPTDLVIGAKLAELLEVRLGQRVVVTAAQAETGELAQEMFRISGIYRFNAPEMDQGMILVRIGQARTLLGLGDRSHEIALRLSSSAEAFDPASRIWRTYSDSANEAVGWPVLLPQLKMAVELSSVSMLIVGLVLFAVVALGIINTLFMSLHERMFEFGLLRAVGTTPGKMAGLVLAEAGALAALSVGLGSLLGLAATGAAALVGFDYTGIEAMGVTFRERIFPVMELRQFVIYPALVFFLVLVVGLYPAVHAARLRPAEAMRRSF